MGWRSGEVEVGSRPVGWGGLPYLSVNVGYKFISKTNHLNNNQNCGYVILK